MTDLMEILIDGEIVETVSRKTAVGLRSILDALDIGASVRQVGRDTTFSLDPNGSRDKLAATRGMVSMFSKQLYEMGVRR